MTDSVIEIIVSAQPDKAASDLLGKTQRFEFLGGFYAITTGIRPVAKIPYYRVEHLSGNNYGADVDKALNHSRDPNPLSRAQTFDLATHLTQRRWIDLNQDDRHKYRMYAAELLEFATYVRRNLPLPKEA